MLCKVGSYVGNGSAGHAITGVGFQPDVVLVKGGANWLFGVTSTMAADATRIMAYSASDLYAGYITALGADGFTVGSSSEINANGATFYYLALKADAADLKVGSYTGNSGTQAITGVGFAPNAVLTLPGAGLGRPTYLKTSDMASTASLWIGNGGSVVTDRITALGADGFTLAADADVNFSGGTYHYLALKTAAGVFEPLTYTGNGADDRSIATASFTPDAAFLKGNTVTASTAAALRFAGETGDNSFQIDQTAEAANKIQSLITNGVQVGTDASVNENTKSYYGLLFKQAAGGGSPSGSARMLLLGVG